MFNIKYGVNLELINCTETNDDDSVNFVARSGENNGVVARVKKIDGLEPQKAGLISVAGGGSVLSTFYQDKPFYSGRDLYVLDAKSEQMDKYSKIFISTIIKKQSYKYSYGRQANKDLPNIIIKLPCINDEPDYKFMSDFIKKMPYGDRI